MPIMSVEQETTSGTIRADIQAQSENRRRSGQGTVYTCPECGGVLWQAEAHGLVHFQCHVGHAYSARNLLLQKSEMLESVLWVAVRLLTEKATLTRQRLAQAPDEIDAEERARIEELAGLDERHRDMLREMLLEVHPNPMAQAHIVEDAFDKAGRGENNG